METHGLPPEKKASFASPLLVYIIVGIIAASLALFIILRP
jgi:hypothetical protein